MKALHCRDRKARRRASVALRALSAACSLRSRVMQLAEGPVQVAILAGRNRDLFCGQTAINLEELVRGHGYCG